MRKPDYTLLLFCVTRPSEPDLAFNGAGLSLDDGDLAVTTKLAPESVRPPNRHGRFYDQGEAECVGIMQCSALLSLTALPSTLAGLEASEGFSGLDASRPSIATMVARQAAPWCILGKQQSIGDSGIWPVLRHPVTLELDQVLVDHRAVP